MSLELFSDRAGICIIDVQEKLASAMVEKVLKGTLRNWLNLIETARIFNLPTIISEQYPQGLGRTLPVVTEAALRLERDRVVLFDKVQFSCGGLSAFDSALKRFGRDQWIVCGMEAHVCVYQTVRSMVAAGMTVHVPRDAVISRTMANWESGINLIEQTGATVTSTEVVIFDLLKQAGTDNFRKLSRLIK